MNIKANSLGAIAAATVMTLGLPLATSAQTDPAGDQASAMDQTTMQVDTQDTAMAQTASLMDGAQAVADNGVSADAIRIVSVGNRPRLAMDQATMDAVNGALAARVAQGTGQAYTNSPSPGTLADMLHAAGYDPSQIVGMQSDDDGGVTIMVTDASS